MMSYRYAALFRVGKKLVLAILYFFLVLAGCGLQGKENSFIAEDGKKEMKITATLQGSPARQLSTASKAVVSPEVFETAILGLG